MSEQEKDKTLDTPSKRRIPFWYVVVGAFVLMVAYQSGRSAGVRSKPDVVEPMAASSPAEPVITVLPGGDLQPAARMRSAESRPQPVRRVVDNQAPAVPVRQPVQVARPASAPARVIETGGSFAPEYPPVDRTQVPSSVPVHSVYERPPTLVVPPAPTSAVLKPSELGLMPLQPLAPLPGAVVYPGAQVVRTTFKEPTLAPAVPVTYSQPVSVQQSVPATTVKTAVPCDCGKAH